MDINYQILFTIELLHEYFVDGKNTEVEIIPAKDSQSLFEEIDIQWRHIDHKFIALIRENDQQEPFINKVPEKLYRKFFDQAIIRLYLKLKDADFLNYTNIPAFYNKVFYFSNLANNKIEVPPPKLPFLYLSPRIDDHTTGQEYLPGDFVMKPATDLVFEAIKKHTSAALADLNNPALWMPRQKRQFSTGTSGVVFSGARYIFTLSAVVTDATVQVFGFNFDEATPDFTIPVGEAEIRHFESPVREIVIDLNELLPGRYKLQVNTESIIIYYDPQIENENIFGVIEMFTLSATDDYAFLDADEKIQLKEYTLQFPARNVLWKYIRKDNTAQTITDTGTTNYVFNLAEDEFVSAVPIPLSEAALNTLKLDFSTTDHALSPLPNPTANRLGRHHQDDFDYSTAEVFLNY